MRTQQHIKAGTLVEFMDLVAGCVARGLTFEADASTLTIWLTGGY
jgi:hypothetical protein